jgi:Domain of unknown function (DUF4352)
MRSQQPSGEPRQQAPDGPHEQAPDGPHEQPPRKRRRGLTITLGVAGGVVVLGIVAAVLGWGKTGTNVGGSATTSTGAATSPGTQNAGGTAAAGIGEKVRDGEFEFVVTKVTHRKSVGGRQFGLGQTAQGTFTIISLKVTNIGSERQNLHDNWQYVYDASGRKFTNNVMADLALSGSNGHNNRWLGAVGPGKTVHGQIAFDLPVGDRAVKIQLHASMLSHGATVRLSST